MQQVTTVPVKLFVCAKPCRSELNSSVCSASLPNESSYLPNPLVQRAVHRILAVPINLVCLKLLGIKLNSVFQALFSSFLLSSSFLASSPTPSSPTRSRRQLLHIPPHSIPLGLPRARKISYLTRIPHVLVPHEFTFRMRHGFPPRIWIWNVVDRTRDVAIKT
jgi:hypothetical protein